MFIVLGKFSWGVFSLSSGVVLKMSWQREGNFCDVDLHMDEFSFFALETHSYLDSVFFSFIRFGHSLQSTHAINITNKI